MKRLLPALLFALAVALPGFLLPSKHHTLELSVTSGRHAAIVLSTNLGRGFNDDDQSASALFADNEPRTYRFDLPSGRYKGFRIDFIDVAGPVSVSDIRIGTPDDPADIRLPLANFQTTDRIAPVSGQDSILLTPAVGKTSSSLALSPPQPLVLDAPPAFWSRTLIAVPLFLAAFAFAWWCPGWLGLKKIIGFGREPASAEITNHTPPNNRFALWGTLLAAAAILFVRMPDRFLHPQFYAEDGYFYACAVEHGAKTFVMPYGGYLLTADRLFAAAAIHLPALYAPAFFNFAALLIALGVLSRIFSSRLNLPAKPLLALVVVLIPRPQDIFLTITNIQWVLALALVLLLLSDDARLRRQHFYDGLAAGVIGLTGVFSVLLSPFFAFRAWRRRTATSLTVAAIVGLAAAIQLWLVLTTPHDSGQSLASTPLTIPSIIGHRFFCLTFGGPWLVHAWKFLLPVFAALVVGWAIVLSFPARGNTPAASTRRFILAIMAVLTAASLFRYRDMLPLYLSAGYSRYFYLPQVLLIWLIIFELGSTCLRHSMAVVALYAFFLTTLHTFRLEPLVDYRWSDYAPQIDQGRDVWLPINPVGWQCHLPDAKK